MTCETLEPTVTVTITWGEGEEDTLVLPDDCVESGAWWNVLVLPDWTVRRTVAPPSAWVSGDVLLAAVREAASLSMTVAVQGTTLADVETQKAIVEGALLQYPAVVAIDADGVSLGEWATQPTLPQWGAVTPQDLGMLAAEAAVVIPVNPVGAP